MTVAHDAGSELEFSTADPATWTHTPVGTPRGVVVWIGHGGDTDRIAGVTYGGVTMARIETAHDTAGEESWGFVYFLGSSIPTGAQTVSIDTDASAPLKFAACATMTAAADTEVVVTGKLETDQANPQIAIDTGATSSLRYFGITTGLNAPSGLTLIAGMTAIHNADLGSIASAFAHQTTAATGSVTVGWTAASDDVAMIAVGVQEVVPATQNLTGSLFSNSPSFFVGALDAGGTDQNLTGSLYVSTATFFAGRVARAVPTGLVLNEIGVLGHSSVGTFVDWYRLLSSADLLTQISHGGIHARVWGDPADPGYAAAWAKLDDDQPVGGYRAFWVMLGFLDSYTETQAEREAWIDHIAGRLLTDFPTIEYTWWSPMTSMFDDDAIGLDGDAEDLVALDPWGANPSSLTVWSGAGLVQSVEQSWEATVYALANGYADDYGPWVNLHQSITDADGRHPSEAAGGDPPPNGQTHGGDILLAFFEGVQGMAGTLFVSTATFGMGTVTAGTVTLDGTLHTSTPTFFAGVLTLDQPLTGTLFVKAPTFFAGLILSTVDQRPNATTSNDGWDTAPTPGQPIHSHLAADDADYITVTV